VACHLVSFREDPRKPVSIIEALKTDPARYVQRSVANNLADVIKDDPQYGLSVAKSWSGSAMCRHLRLVVPGSELHGERFFE